MKKIILSLTIFLCLSAVQVAKADELYKYTSVICMPEIDTLWINALNLYNTAPPDWDKILTAKYNPKANIPKKVEFLQGKYNIFSYNVETTCNLKKDVYKIIVKQDQGRLTIYRNDKKILQDIHFNMTDVNYLPSVMQIIIFNNKVFPEIKILAYPDDTFYIDTYYKNLLVMEKNLNELSKPITNDDLCAQIKKEQEKGHNPCNF